jgi:hypothetical protein
VKEFTAREKCGPGTRTVKEDRYAGCSGRDLLEHYQPFAGNVRLKCVNPVTLRPGRFRLETIPIALGRISRRKQTELNLPSAE